MGFRSKQSYYQYDQQVQQKMRLYFGYFCNAVGFCRLYSPILFKHTIGEREFYIFQTLELIDFRKNIDIADSLNKKYQILGHMYDGVNTPLNDIKTLREWYKGIRHDYGIGFDERVKIGSAILRLESNLIKSIVEEYDRKVAPKIKISLNLLEEFSSLYKDKIKGLDNIHEIVNETSDISSTLYDLKELKNNLQALIINKNNSLLTLENTLNLFNENLHNLIRFEEIKSSHPEICNEWELKEFKGKANHYEIGRANKALNLLKLIPYISN